LNIQAWERYLASYPDKQFSQFIIRGIRDGFRLGFDSQLVDLKQNEGNMLSAIDHPAVVSDYIKEETLSNRTLYVGSPAQAAALGIHCSPFGVIPKKNKPGKWRLILDLSSPADHSVNDGISKEACSLSYISVDDVAACVVMAGRGAMLAKLDIKHAYRNIPVHPHDRWLLGMSWGGNVFIDATLPFGLRSAPIIFSAVADALLWIMQQKGTLLVFHYLDDFITVGAPKSEQCGDNLSCMLETCLEMGMPVEADKSEGPASCITFLGIELDTLTMELRLPGDKLNNLQRLLKEWRGRTAGRKREFLSLIGVLSHACKVVRAGRSFLRRLIDRSTVVERLDHYVRLNLPARSDIEWWYQFSSKWNGSSMLTNINKRCPSAVVTSDASGTWGCGAWSEMEWFQLKWNSVVQGYHITVKEMLPIVIAAAIWGKKWKGGTVQVRCDNSAVVSIINQGTSHDHQAMHLARCLAFIMAEHQFYMFATHLPGVENIAADALSRNKLHLFQSTSPQANHHPTGIPEDLLDLLIITKPDWTSPSWTKLWTNIFYKA